MPKRLDDLYQSFFKQQDFNELKLSVEENHKLLIDRLSKEDRKVQWNLKSDHRPFARIDWTILGL